MALSRNLQRLREDFGLFVEACRLVGTVVLILFTCTLSACSSVRTVEPTEWNAHILSTGVTTIRFRLCENEDRPNHGELPRFTLQLAEYCDGAGPNLVVPEGSAVTFGKVVAVDYVDVLNGSKWFAIGEVELAENTFPIYQYIGHGGYRSSDPLHVSSMPGFEGFASSE